MESNMWVEVSLTRGPIRGRDRNKIGLLVKVQAHPEVEGFVSQLSGGRTLRVADYAESWYDCNSDGPNRLEFYESEFVGEYRSNYTLNSLGSPLLINNGGDDRPRVRNASPEEIVNLSFLRLTGISKEGGVCFGIVGAYSGEYIKRVRGLLPTALKQFLQDYVVPITVHLQVSSKG